MPQRIRIVLWGSTIFLSSFLLFLIEPIFAKLILPWFGGSAAVWTTCLVFYQAALLAGYAYSFFLAKRVSPRPQAWVHVALLAAAIALLPLIGGAHWQPGGAGTSAVTGHPVARILAILTLSIGLPYILLSATAPLLQEWYSRVESREPYRLYSLSNAAALLALLAYPVWIEPQFATHTQDRLWSIGFIIFAILCAASSMISARAASGMSSARASMADGASTLPTDSLASDGTHDSDEQESDGEESAGSPGQTDFAEWIPWIALPAAGSMLLLSITNELTQNVAPVPLLWIAPLAVYLLTFVLCFATARWYHRGVFLRFLAVGLAGVGYSIYDIRLSDPILISIPIFLMGLFLGCMFCHGELALRKPEPARLTSFYLMIAAGGAMGAIFVGLIAPAIFSAFYELPVALAVVAALALWVNIEAGAAWPAKLLWLTATLAMLGVCGSQVFAYHYDAIELVRNFYGSLRVTDSGAGNSAVRILYHGTIEHGSQFLNPQKRRTPTTYYGSASGVGLALEYFNRHARSSSGGLRVGVVGLGTGTLAAYGRAGDEYHFYEINPQVVGIARNTFFYLRDSPAKIDVTPGDARLSLEEEPARNFDVLVLDAFSGDAIPVHLLTREAFALYFRHLKPSGALALHVSNVYLDLAPVVAGLAHAYGRPAFEIHTEKDASRQILGADWILVSSNRDLLEDPEIRRAGEPAPLRPALRVWTDDYNNLLQVVRWLPSS